MATATLDLTRREALVTELAQAVNEPPARVTNIQYSPLLAALKAAGTQLWLDTGNLEEATKLWRGEMSALTTNNTLANAVVQTGIMDDEIANAAKLIREVDPGISVEDLVMDIVFIVNSHIALRLVHAFDALVSVELHPALGNDIEKTFRYAQRYYAVNPDRFIVKIPLTPEGYCAVARARQEGIPINYTLGFSARQNYLAGAVARPNYVNVFLGRLNAVVADNGLGDGKLVGEKVTLASQAGLRELRRADDSIPTEQIAASMRNADQMVALAGVDVFTIPPKAVQEFYDKGYNAADIKDQTNESYEATFHADADMTSLERLWTIDDNFKKFTQELAARGGHTLTGDDLRQADKDFGTQLFADFTEEEKTAIRTGGKIPKVAQWQGRASLDALMTESALQSFIVDQKAFDDRILQHI